VPPDFGVRLAEVVGTFLERGGMADVRAADPPYRAPAGSDLQATARGLAAHVKEHPLATAYAFYVALVARDGLPPEIRTVVVNSAGEVVFSRADTEFDGPPPNSPMMCCVHVAGVCREVWGLDDPMRENAPEGRMAARLRERSGLPPQEELDAIRRRWERAKAAFRTSQCSVYPVNVWGRDSASAEGAATLAGLLNEKGICRAGRTAPMMRLDLRPDPNQQRVLWDTARAFREYLLESPPGTPYALYVDCGPLPQVHHVHVVLCDGDGEWLIVDFQNSYQEDFARIAPGDLEGCLRLVVDRLTHYLR
jgi:hypothetical protein